MDNSFVRLTNRVPVKTSLLAFVLISWLLVGCDPQVAESTKKQHAPDATELAQMKWLEIDRKLGEVAAAREKELAAVRADLAAPWSDLVVALRYDCSCTGTSYTGFRISRDADTFAVTPWGELDGWSRTAGPERTGERRQLSKAAVEKLLSEAALFYLAATLSESAGERVGPFPTDVTKQAEWRERYLAAGGSPLASDRLWIDIQVVTSDGLKRHTNMWARYVPPDFWKWITAFGDPSRR